jgi:hypothetical protein
MHKMVLAQTPATYSTWWAGLSTANPADDGQSVAEPTATNGYARVAITWNTLTVYTSVTVDTASIASNSNSIAFTSSGGAFSTGATNLTHVHIQAASTGTAETGFQGRAAIAVPQAVNAAGITLTIAPSGLTMNLISA